MAGARAELQVTAGPASGLRVLWPSPNSGTQNRATMDAVVAVIAVIGVPRHRRAHGDVAALARIEGGVIRA